MSDALKDDAEQLEAANRELASLTYSISHDLRAPLRTIDGFSEALIEDYGAKLDDQALEYLKRIRSAAISMNEMIVSLAELARVSREELRRERVNVSEIAQSIANRLQQKEPSRNVEVVIEPNLSVDADPRLMTVVFDQLLGNAWKFTRKHKSAKIEVGSENRDGTRILFVRDDGAGFDATYAAKMFGAFQRLHAAHEFEGIGMGLGLVQRIVNRHGGKVWATGEVERGATVYLDLR